MAMRQAETPRAPVPDKVPRAERTRPPSTGPSGTEPAGSGAPAPSGPAPQGGAASAPIGPEVPGRAVRLAVVLVAPEIPPNTGNVSRTCVVTGSELHLVRPLGFSLADRYLRRAGLDYWPALALRVHDSWPDARRVLAPRPVWLFTGQGGRPHTAVPFRGDDALVFGCESAGLPPDILAAFPDRWVRLPMLPGWRSLNLSNAVAVAVYEALRQHGFPGMR